VEDPTTKRRQPRNYTETLEQRVALLEGILQRARPDLPNDNLSQGYLQGPEVQPGPSSLTPLINECGGQSTTFTAVGEHDGLNELASQVGTLSLNAAGAEPHYLGSSSTFAFSRMINSSLRQVVSRNSNSTFGQSQDNASMLTPCLLPDYEAGVNLSNAYFENIHPQYPFLHEPTFRGWELTITTGSGALDTPSSDPIPLFFLNMVGYAFMPSRGKAKHRRSMPLVLYFYPNQNTRQKQVIKLVNL
jgi:hypothetical protein